jgi:hypothetical protein
MNPCAKGPVKFGQQDHELSRSLQTNVAALADRTPLQIQGPQNYQCGGLVHAFCATRIDWHEGAMITGCIRGEIRRGGLNRQQNRAGDGLQQNKTVTMPPRRGAMNEGKTLYERPAEGAEHGEISSAEI